MDSLQGEVRIGFPQNALRLDHMELTLATPALVLPAASLLLLVYANRFLAVAKLIRDLHAAYKAGPDQTILEQIETLRRRVVFIRNMHALGIASLFMCVLCMFLLFLGYSEAAKYVFALGLLLLLGSLGIAAREIQISVDALNLHLSGLRKND